MTASSSAPRVEPASVENVLEPCAYAPTYVVKDFPIARYQGLQFVSVGGCHILTLRPPGACGSCALTLPPQVYLSFVYPNDHTRLTHMETENKCFYRESPLYLERCGGSHWGRAGPPRQVSEAPHSPRFGFYKYMKMDKEEGEEEEVQRRAFLFLNPEGEFHPGPALR